MPVTASDSCTFIYLHTLVTNVPLAWLDHSIVDPNRSDAAPHWPQFTGAFVITVIIQVFTEAAAGETLTTFAPSCDLLVAGQIL